MSYPGSVVLDFFAGSGVTTRVCIEEKRHSIISDIDPTLNQYMEKHLHQIKDKKHQFQILREEGISKYLEKLP
jgi:DNA methylase.